MSETDAEPLYCLEIWGENVMGLRAARVPIPRDGIIASGDNGQGKSTFLDLLRFLLGGKSEWPKVLLNNESFHGELGTILGRDGQVKYRVELHIEQDADPKLRVTDASGVPVPKPSTVLAGLYGALTFDVGAFIAPPGAKTPEAKLKEQVKMLLEAVPLDIDLAATAKRRELLYSQRHRANQDVDTNASKLRLLSKRDVPTRIDLDAKRAAVRQSYETKQQATTILSRVEAIDRRGAEMKAEWEKLKAEREELTKRHAALPPAADTATLETEISAGERTNEEAIRIVAGNAAYDEMMKSLGDAKKSSDDLGAAIKALDAEKLAALARAKFPYPGLSVDEVLGVTLTENGHTLPYLQLNTARQAEIAVAICSALAPDLRVARMSGNDLDQKTLAAVCLACHERGLQYLIERWMQDTNGALIFEAGRIKGRVVVAAPERVS